MEQWKSLNIPNYEVEIWHKNGEYIADISHILTSGLNISWTLNDVEDLSFTLDLVQFKKKCQKMGVKPEEVLIPYVHDIRIRRNGEYILGTQVVELNISIDNNAGATLEVKCTGFLNLFKDMYITAQWDAYTYSEIAHKLVKESQESDNLIKNGTFDIDTEGWGSLNGKLEHNKIKSSSHSGQGHLRLVCTAPNSWVSGQTRINATSGTKVKVDVWWNGENGRKLCMREREAANKWNTQRTLIEVPATGSGWIHSTFEYETVFDYGYLSVEANLSGPGAFMWVDDLKITNIEDNPNLGIKTGVDMASTHQENTRQRNYSLQAVKEAITALTTLDRDNFDFEFTPERVFNTYHRKGEDKPNIIASYPGNIHSLSINRSASSLANKITVIGSGIGDERIEVTHRNKASISKYGTREKTITANNVVLKSTLSEQAIGELWDRKDPTNLPTIKIEDGSINPGNVQVGDSIQIKVENDSYIEDINGMYRVVRMNVDVSQENKEAISLTLEPKAKRPTPIMVRYIKNTLNGSDKNNSNHLVELEAYITIGNRLENVAKGKPVLGSSPVNNSSVATDGDRNTASFSSVQDGRNSFIIDLGQEYPLDYIRVWHYYADQRTYRDNVLSIGKTVTMDNQPLEHIVWDYTGYGYIESENGKPSKWIQEEAI